MHRVKKIDEHDVTIHSRSDLKVGCVRVTRGMLEDLLADLDDYRPPHKFKVGDWVRLTEDYMDIKEGQCGKIIRSANETALGTLYAGFPGGRAGPGTPVRGQPAQHLSTALTEGAGRSG